MNLIYSPRSVRDLESIATYYRSVAGPQIAAKVGERLEYVLKLLAEYPEGYPRLAERRDLAALGQTVIKDDTLLPGEWYGGQLQFDAPEGSSPKGYSVTVPIGSDTHQFQVVQAAAAQG